MLWRIELFGGLSARHGDRVIEHCQTRKTEILLAYLAYYSRSRYRHPRQQLIDLLWPDADLDAARNRLTQALVSLRLQLEPPEIPRRSVLIADRHSIGLHPDRIVTDTAEFEAALESSHTASELETKTLALRDAVDLYHDELLVGYDDEWVLTERQRLFDAYFRALRRLVRLFERSQQPGRALEYARRAVKADPRVEEAHCDLVRLLAANGQPAAALRQFHEMERILIRELNEAPSREAYTLADRIRQNDPSFALSQPDSRSAGRKAPAPLTRFIGREAEITQVERMIRSDRARLVTLIGPGGCGKTRLAVETIARLAVHYGDGVCFVPLLDLEDADLVSGALADALRLSRSGMLPILEQIVEYLSRCPFLLVLDNLEHLLEETTPLLQELLERIPTLTILITSRRRLGLDGEREIPVQPLEVPGRSVLPGIPEITPRRLMQIESVQLFVDRAQAVRPAFQVTSRNADAVSRLCERLEGIPLAIELCAAWAQTLTPVQMLEQLTNRLDLLVSRRMDIPARHRTLRATLESSYRQLSPALQQFFVGLSVFRAGWTLEAAEAVCLDQGPDHIRTLDFLTDLRERSLITAEESGDTGSEMRYRMLETLREFVMEQRSAVVNTTELLRRHASHFLALAEAAETHLSGPVQGPWLRRLETEHDNLRAALAWTLENRESEMGLRLAGALAPFWDARGYLGEGQQWLAPLLSLADLEERSQKSLSIRAKALTARGQLARNQGASAEVNAAMQEALRLWRKLGDERGMAASLQILATLAYSRDDSDAARGFLHEGLQIARELQDASLVARALMNLGNLALGHREWPQAWSLYSESLSLYRTEGCRNRIAYALNNLGLVARYQGDFSTALTLLHEALTISRELSDRSGMATASLNLGTVNRLVPHYGSARSFLRDAVLLASEAGEKRLLIWCVKELGNLACSQEDYEAGVRLLSAAESLRLPMGLTFKPSDPDDLERDTALAHAALGEAGFAAAWAAGSGLSLEDVFAMTFPGAETE